MSEPEVTHHIVGFEGGLEIVEVNADTDSHQHMLRSLYNLFSIFHQIRALERLEPEIVVVEVPREIEVLLDLLSVFLDHSVHVVGQHGSGAAHLVLDLRVEAGGHLKEIVSGALVQIRNRYIGGQLRISRVDDCHVGASFCRQVVQIVSFHTYK
jgi:hypothetical protein